MLIELEELDEGQGQNKSEDKAEISDSMNYVDGSTTDIEVRATGLTRQMSVILHMKSLKSLYKSGEDWYLVLRIVGVDLKTVI